MRKPGKLLPISWEDLPKLKPDRDTDHFIAENVFRYHWRLHYHPGGPRHWHWRRGDHLYSWGQFKPSKDISLALQLVECLVEQYSWSDESYIKIQISVKAGEHWNVKTIWKQCDHEEVLHDEFSKDLPLNLCRAMLAAYLACGPKDYENDWRLPWQGPDTWPPQPEADNST